MRGVSVAMGLLASAVAEAGPNDVMLVVEGAVSAVAPPGNVPRPRCNEFACDNPVPVPYRLGAGLQLGEVFYFGARVEHFTATAWEHDPRILELKAGFAVWPEETEAMPVGWLMGQVYPYVAYREVRDMESREEQVVVSTGRGVQAGFLASGEGANAMGYLELAVIGYTSGWPAYDRSRMGFLCRLGAVFGPVTAGVRFDGDPGAGMMAGAEVGFFGLLNANPKAWGDE